MLTELREIMQSGIVCAGNIDTAKINSAHKQIREIVESYKSVAFIKITDKTYFELVVVNNIVLLGNSFDA